MGFVKFSVLVYRVGVVDGKGLDNLINDDFDVTINVLTQRESFHY